MKTSYNLNLYENILTLFIFCSNKLYIHIYDTYLCYKRPIKLFTQTWPDLEKQMTELLSKF